MDSDAPLGVRIITAAPEVTGVLPQYWRRTRIRPTWDRILYWEQVCQVTSTECLFGLLRVCVTSISMSDFATEAVRRGARLITHLSNAMPQLHHRDPSIICLLGASPHLSPPSSPTSSPPTSRASRASPVSSARISSNQASLRTTTKAQSEAFDDHETPPQTLMLAASRVAGRVPRLGLHLEKGQVADLEFERPFYELIVDDIHSHPNSVRVCPSDAFTMSY
jgi:N-acetylglucosamine-6-phosphate deacetylase